MATTMRISQKKQMRPRNHEDTKKRSFSYWPSSCVFRAFVSSRSSRSCRRGLSRQAAQLVHETWQDARDEIDFFLGRECPEAEAQRILRAVRRQSHGAQHVRR